MKISKIQRRSKKEPELEKDNGEEIAGRLSPDFDGACEGLDVAVSDISELELDTSDPLSEEFGDYGTEDEDEDEDEDEFEDEDEDEFEDEDEK